MPEIYARWPDPEGAPLLRDAGVTVAIGPATAAFARACLDAGLLPYAELAPGAPAPPAGFRGIVLDTPDDLVRHKASKVLVHVNPDQIHRDVAPAQPILRVGQWPGVRSGPNVKGRGIEVATASREPWVDANSYLVAYLKDVYPQRPPLLGYQPDGPAASPLGVELAVAEAVLAGGNAILSLPADYRAALLRGDEKARDAWRSLGRTISFLRGQADLFRLPNRARVAFAAGTLDQSGELLRLMFRRNLFPVVMPAQSLPPLAASRFRGLVMVNLPPPAGPQRDRILAFARAGGVVITTGWSPPGAAKTRSDPDRDFHSLGQGRMVTYRDPIADPSEFALDVIDIVGVRTRDLRLWNAAAVMGQVQGSGARAVLHLVNYGDSIEEFPARVDGLFRQATLREPSATAPRPLPAVKRGQTTEITVQRLGRLATIVLE